MDRIDKPTPPPPSALVRSLGEALLQLATPSVSGGQPDGRQVWQPDHRQPADLSVYVGDHLYEFSGQGS